MIEERCRRETGLVYQVLIDDTTREVEGVVVATAILPEDREFLESNFKELTVWVTGSKLGVNKRGEEVFELALVKPKASLKELKSKYKFEVPWRRSNK